VNQQATALGAHRRQNRSIDPHHAKDVDLEGVFEGRGFFRRPDHHLQRVTRTQVGGCQRLQYAQRGDRSQVAVEVPAMWHRIDM
jgi:hypothetical protein